MLPGNISILAVQKVMTNARMAAYHIPVTDSGKTFLEYDTFTEKYYTFLASVETDVSRELYDLPLLEEWPGLKVNFHLGYLGSASLNTVATLHNAATGQVLASNTNTVVCVDKTTRKPTLIPDWWKEKYANAVIGNRKLQIEPFPTPDDAFCYQVKVSWSDVDIYKHNNYISYIKYCLDAAMDAMVKGELEKFEGDITEHFVKRMEVLYIGESLACDIIDVFVWQDASDHNTLFFSMNNGTKNIFQSQIQFFPVE